MENTKDPIKRKQLYDFLKENNLVKSDYNSFTEKYSEEGSSTQLYSFLKDNNLTKKNEQDFHKEYFGDIKKKEDTESTSSDPNLVSQATTENGSSGTPKETKGGLVQDIDAGKYDDRINELQAENDLAEQQQNTSINDLIKRKEQNTSITDQDIYDIETTLKEESEGDFGFFGNLKNKIVSAPLIGNAPNPFYNPIKQGNIQRETEIRNRIAKQKNVKPEEVDYSTVKDIALSERREQLIQQKKEAKTEEFIETLTPEEQNKLTNYFNIKSGNLSNSIKTNLLDLSSKESKLEEISKKLDIIKSKHDETKQYPKEYYDNAIKLQEEGKLLAKEYNDTLDAFGKQNEDLLSTKEELDLFKRNYDKWDNFTGKLGIAAEDMMYNFTYMFNKVNKINPLISDDGFNNSEASIIEEKDRLNQERNQYRKAKDITNLQSWEDLGEWASDLIAEQAPNTALMISSGGSSLPLMATTSAGAKLYSLEEEERLGIAEYSNLEKYGASFLTGAAEALSEKISLGQINKAKRVFNSVSKNALKENTISYLRKKIPVYFKDVGEEGATESISQFAENLTDKYLLGKDVNLTEGVGESFISGAFMSGLVYKMPGIAKGVIDLATPKDVNQKIGENFNSILKINEQLKQDLQPITKQKLEEKKQNLLNSNKSLIDKTIEVVDKLNNKDKGSLLAIENEKFKLRKEAKSINEDNLSEESKQDLLKDISENINRLDTKKEQILNPTNAETKETTQKTSQQEVETTTPETETKPKEVAVEDTPAQRYINNEVTKNNKKTFLTKTHNIPLDGLDPNFDEDTKAKITKNKSRNPNQPITVGFEEGKLVILDGAHRFYEAQERGDTTIKANFAHGVGAETYWDNNNTSVTKPQPLNIKESNTETLEKRQSELEELNDVDSKKEFNAIDNELSKREWQSVLNSPLNEVEDVIDNLIKKNKEMPNGFGAYIDKRDARETKNIAKKYQGNIDKKTAKKDFKDAFFGNPNSWYADGLKLRESTRVFIEQGGTFKGLLYSVQKEFESDGFTENDAADVINKKLSEISKTNETTPTEDTQPNENLQPTTKSSEQQGENNEISTPPKPEPSKREVSKPRSVKNAKELQSTYKDIFGTDRVKSYASAVVSDKIIETIAKRSGKTKEDVYKSIQFKKGDQDTFKQLKSKGKALFQIVGQKANLSKTVKNNLEVAREMESQGKDNESIFLNTGWQKGTDGKWKYDMHEGKVNIKEGIGSIEDFVEYPEFFKAYPEAKKIQVRVYNKNGNLSGSFGNFKGKDVLFVNTNKGIEESKLTLLHELQHWVQEKEGFSKGGNKKLARETLNKKIKNAKSKGLKRALIDFKSALSRNKNVSESLKKLEKLSSKNDFELYQSLAGEVEARNVESRYGMDADVRRNTPLNRTEDVAQDEQLVLFQGDQGAMLAEDGKYIIYALTDPNVSTPMHELAHVYESYLTDNERKSILDWAGHKKWTRETSEKFAQGFEKYLTEANSNDKTLNKIFEKFKEWLTDIYNGLQDLDIELSPKMNAIYDTMIGNTKTFKTKRINPKGVKGEFDVTINEDGTVTKITSKNGREISKWRYNKEGKPIGKNANYSKIEAEATNSKTENELKAEEKETLSKALDNYTPTNEYDYAKEFLARGNKIDPNSAKSETGLSDKELKWATFSNKKGNLPSIEAAAEYIVENSDQELDLQEVRNSLIDLLTTNNSVKPIQESIISQVKEANYQQEQQELDAYLNTLSELEYSKYQGQIEEDSFLSELSFEEKIEYYEGQYRATEENKTQELKGNERKRESSSNSVQERSKSKEENNRKQETPKIDDNLQSQGLSFQKENNRDNALSKEGAVKQKNARQRKFKRFWNNTFSSSRGLDKKVVRVIESLIGELSSISASIEYEASQFSKISNHIKKSFKKDYNDKMRLINDYLSGIDSDMSFLKPEHKDILDSLRGRIDKLSDKIIKTLDDKKLKLSKKNQTESIKDAIKRIDALIETIQGNKGKYMFRQYDAFSNKDYLNALTSKYPNLSAKKRLKEAVEFVANEQGITEVEAKKQILTYLDDLKGGGDFVSSSTNGKAKAPFLKKRKDIPEPIRKLLGESKDPVKNYVSTVFNMSKYIANIEYQNRLNNTLFDTGIAKNEIEPGYTKLVKSQEGWDLLQDIYVPEEIAEGIEDLQPLDSIKDDVYKTLVMLASATKLGKTVLSPTTSARNFLSGVFLSFNAGFNPLTSPKRFVEGIYHAWGGKKSNTELKEQNQRLIKLGIIQDGAVSKEILGIMNDFSSPIEKQLSDTWLKKAMNVMQKLYALGDDTYKVIGFYKWEKRYKKAGFTNSEAEIMASERIRNGFPTYSKIPKNIQKLRRIPLIGTFPSFTYEIFRTNLNNIKFIGQDLQAGIKNNDKQRLLMAGQQASGMLIASSMAYGISALTKSMLGIDDDEDETTRNMSAEWQKDSKYIYLGKQNGVYEVIDATAFFPQETISKPFRILFEEREGRDIDDKLLLATDAVTNTFIGADLFAKTISELHSNKNNYGQEIYEGNSILEGISKNPDKITHYILRQSGPGFYNNITEFARANNIAPDFFGDKETSYKEYTNQEALLGLLGFRVSRINYVLGINSLGYNAKEKYNFKRSELSKKLKTTQTLSEDKVKELIKDYKSSNKESYSVLKVAIRGAKKQGISKNDIVSALKSSNFSKEDIESIYLGNDPKLKNITSSTKKRAKLRLEIGRFKDDPKKLNELKNKLDSNIDFFNFMVDLENFKNP